MANAASTKVNWEPYEAEIIPLYVDQNQTLEVTMAHMKDKYGLRATEKQYKTKFSGYKNLKAGEWPAVAQEVHKRALEGKESDVFLYGRLLFPKRVKRRLAHSQSSIPNPNSEAAIGTSLQDRIFIRTPPIPSASPPPLQAAVAQHAVDFDVHNELSFDLNHDIDPDSVGPSTSLFPISIPNFTAMSPCLTGVITESMNSQHSTMVETSLFFENFDPDTFRYINTEIELTYNLPWFKLQTVMEQPGFIYTSPVVDDIFRTHWRPGTPPTSLHCFSRVNLTLDERCSLLSGFLSPNSKAQVANYITHFTAYLRNLVPERQDGELYMNVRKLFDPSNKCPLYQIFEFATYFSSNNMLTPNQTDVFLKWVVDQNQTDLLKSFLQTKTPTVQAFSTRILESGVRIKDTKFLILLLNSGVKFDTILEQAFQIEDSHFLELLLHSEVDSALLSGTSGGKLLHKIARTNYTEIAQILIQNGAEVNLPILDDTNSTSLFEAVCFSNISMVKCLLTAGAYTETRSKYAPYKALARAVYRNNPDITVALLEKGATIDCCRIYGETLLEWSSKRDRNVYRVLLERVGRGNQGPTVGDIISAAERGTQALSNFIRRQKAAVLQSELEKALTASLKQSNIRATSALLDNGADPNWSTLDEDHSPLMIAATLDDIAFSHLLISAGASVNLPGLLNRTAGIGNFELLSLLIDEGANLEIYGPEALETAVQDENIEISALLLNKGTAINVPGACLTGLQAAAWAGNIEFAQYLIERGADINAPARNVDGRTALQSAAEMGNIDMVAFLIGEHADVNAPPARVRGLTALEATVENIGFRETREIFKLLLENGALINRQDGHACRASTILHDLIKENEGDLIRLVVEAGANVTCMSTGEEGRTPLQQAAGMGNIDVAKLLLEHGADVNAPPAYRHGRTALQAATSRQTPNPELVQLLVSNHANVNAVAGVTGGITALQGAAISGHIKIALMLLKLGADVNARPAIKDGRTAIEGAAEHGRLDMVQFLLNAGAIGDVTGKIGFKKAIELAEENQHFAIAQLLRDQQVDGDSMIF